MIIIAPHIDGYALWRADAPLTGTPTTPPLIVAEDELTETIAALLADDLDDYTAAWDQLATATA